VRKHACQHLQHLADSYCLCLCLCLCVCTCRYIYDGPAMQQWLSSHNTSPCTNLLLPHIGLTPVIAVRTAIKEWREQHPELGGSMPQPQQPQVQPQQQPQAQLPPPPQLQVGTMGIMSSMDTWWSRGSVWWLNAYMSPHDCAMCPSTMMPGWQACCWQRELWHAVPDAPFCMTCGRSKL
jgi:hypothetical protein